MLAFGGERTGVHRLPLNNLPFDATTDDIPGSKLPVGDSQNRGNSGPAGGGHNPCAAAPPKHYVICLSAAFSPFANAVLDRRRIILCDQRICRDRVDLEPAVIACRIFDPPRLST